MYPCWTTDRNLTYVYPATGDPLGRFRTPVGVIAASNPVGVIATNRIPISTAVIATNRIPISTAVSRIPISAAAVIANNSAPPAALNSATERLHSSSPLITLNGVPVPPPSDPPSSSGSASSSAPTAHPQWKGGPSTAQPHSNVPFDDFSDKGIRDQALEAILSLVSCSATVAVRVLSVPRLMDILLRVIMVSASSSSSYGGAIVAPNSSAAYSQSDTISAASRVLQVGMRYRLGVFNHLYRLIESLLLLLLLGRCRSWQFC